MAKLQDTCPNQLWPAGLRAARRARAWLLAALLPLAAGCFGPEPVTRFTPQPGECVEGNQAEERNGTDCGCCHRDQFSVSGSIQREGKPVSRVVVEDDAGVRLEMVPNAYGNFFRHSKLVFPLRAWVIGPDGGTREMQRHVSNGSCNSCHRHGGEAARISGP